MAIDHTMDLNKLFGGIDFNKFVRIVSSYSHKGWREGDQVGRDETKAEFGRDEIQDEYVLRALQNKEFLLSEKTKKRLIGDLRETLLEGSRNRESLFDIEKRVKEIFVDFKEYESERVVRTEIMTATNQGRNDAWNRNPEISWKVWHNANIRGKRTALDSKRMFGQIQEKDKPFVDPMDGRSYDMPPMRPNDRCTAIPLRKLPSEIVYIGGQMYDESKVQAEAKKYM